MPFRGLLGEAGLFKSGWARVLVVLVGLAEAYCIFIVAGSVYVADQVAKGEPGFFWDEGIEVARNAALVGIVVVPLVAALLFHVTKWLVNGFRDEG
jgi:uncharacterized membrane protein YuzA (DUF378 family)